MFDLSIPPIVESDHFYFFNFITAAIFACGHTLQVTGYNYLSGYQPDSWF